MHHPEVVKVEPWSKSQGEYVLINKADFDKSKHKLYGAKAVEKDEDPETEDEDKIVFSSKAVAEYAAEKADELKLDLANLVGTGAKGKVTKADVDKLIEASSEDEDEEDDL